MKIDIGVLIAVCGLVISYLMLQFNKQKESKIDTQQDAHIKARLDYISKGVDDIRIDQKANEKQMIQLGERVTRVEESTKQAHHRINVLEKESS